MSAGYTWFGCDLISGQIIDELPVKADSLPSLIGAYSTTSATVALPDAPASWESATEPGRALLVCSRDLDDVIVWGGMVTSRVGGSGPELSLGLATLEAYLDRRYVEDATVSNDEAWIYAELLGMVWEQGAGITWDTPYTGTHRTRTYDSTSDQTIYSQLTELSGVEGGAEWTISLRWNAERTHVQKEFVMRPRLGVQKETPDVVFDFPGNVKAYEFSESFTREDGANHVQVFGDGEGPARPASDLFTGVLPGYPRFEARENRSGVVLKETLNEHARDLLAMLQRGARTVTITADAESAPLLGNGWSLGDAVALEVETSYRHPDGFYLVGRVIGSELDPNPGGSVSPIVLLDY